MTRIGKIARLPREIRDELNRRLERGIHGRPLVEWLNSLPEVQEVVRDHFQGKPVSQQNLSEWRNGGYAEWQTRHEFIDRLRSVAGAAGEIEKACGLMADHAARLLSVRIALILADWNGDPSAPAFAQLKHLSDLVRDIAILRRGDLQAARLKMEQHVFDVACKHHETLDSENAPVPLPSFQKWSRRTGASIPAGPPLKSSPIKPDQTTKTPPPDHLREAQGIKRPQAAAFNPSEPPPAPPKSAPLPRNTAKNSPATAPARRHPAPWPARCRNSFLRPLPHGARRTAAGGK